MAEEKAFLMPIVIDSTADVSASVPEKFREVQWTRLPDGEPTAAFCERVEAFLLACGAHGAAPDDKEMRATESGRIVRAAPLSTGNIIVGTVPD